MPAFSHFFLKRLRARSKFSSSWMMTSDKRSSPIWWRCASVKSTKCDKLWNSVTTCQAVRELSRWPAHRTSAEYVHVQVIHGLPAVLVRVDHQPIARVGDALAPRHLRSQCEQPSEERGVHCVVERTQVLSRQNQHVHRCFRIDVPNRDGIIRGRHDRGRYLAAYDAAEQAGFRHGISP